MRADADKVCNFDRAFEVGAKSFLFKGINGRWREVFTTGEHRGYRHRVCPWLAPRRPFPYRIPPPNVLILHALDAPLQYEGACTIRPKMDRFVRMEQPRSRLVESPPISNARRGGTIHS